MRNRIGSGKRHLYLSLVVVVLIMAVIALMRIWRNTLIDRSLLTDNPCSAPCWYEITPGETTASQALNVLEASSYIEDDSLKQMGDVVAGTCSWEWRVNNQVIPSRMTWQNNLVQEIILSVSYRLTVAEVIKKFGSPEAISATELGTPEHWYLAVDLYYPDQGLQFVAFTFEYSSILEPDTLVGMAYYYAPTTFEDRLLYEYSFLSLAPVEILGKVTSVTRNWKGYGDLLEIYYESFNNMYFEK